MEKVYGNTEEEWDERFAPQGQWEGAGHCAQTALFMEAIVSALPADLSPTRFFVQYGRKPTAVDVGCALGDGVPILQRAGFEAYGLERSPVAVEYASRRFPQCRFAEGATPETFTDYAFCSNVLEHVDDYMGFLCALLCKADYVVILVPWQEDETALTCDHVHSFGPQSFPQFIEYPARPCRGNSTWDRIHEQWVSVAPDVWYQPQYLAVYRSRGLG